jgi:hypothetical protein
VSLGEGPLPAPVVAVPEAGAVTPPPNGDGPAAGPAPAPTAGAVEDGAARPTPMAPWSGAASTEAGYGSGSTVPAVAIPAGETSGGATSADPVPASGPMTGATELAVQPIARPREIGAARLIYGLVGAGAALILLVGGAITRRGRAAWLDA